MKFGDIRIGSRFCVSPPSNLKFYWLLKVSDREALVLSLRGDKILASSLAQPGSKITIDPATEVEMLAAA